MSSIGNDIVDLAFTDTQRTLQPKFYSKFITLTEQELFYQQTALPLAYWVWLLWSVKEAVYKFEKRLHPALMFSPSQIQITSSLISQLSGSESFQNDLYENNNSTNSHSFSNSSSEILFHDKIYYARSVITPQFISTIINDGPNLEGIRSGIQKIGQTDYTSQSQAVRALLLKDLSDMYPCDEFQIRKSPVGYPVVFKNQLESTLKISFAHHGNYVAYAFKA